ncbi:Cold shock-like protein CspA [Rhizoctonia solani AG-1 IB]|uniref:Cold shock-like protein CspA n=1 Tax=Thanatephorus cucumeris (strain AG1-IB / isolate 7/3/14) TaxID=1108050 RepID=M5BN84_THACB|nr:Cold shock-like protein CspA [Rhizoctonia solani AG-1 IB]
MSTRSGSVRWFNDAKGHGFIVPDGGGEDVFVHFKSIIGDGYRSLFEGDLVEFEVEIDNKGRLSARKVMKK